jgi:hypothetical protein
MVWCRMDWNAPNRRGRPEHSGGIRCRYWLDTGLLAVLIDVDAAGGGVAFNPHSYLHAQVKAEASDVMQRDLAAAKGTRDQAAALDVKLCAEASTGFGAVISREITVLLRPL